MKVAAGLSAFALVLAASFGGSMALGHAVGTVGPASNKTLAAGHGEMHVESGSEPDGLSISQDGYTLHLMQAPTSAGVPGTLAFTITEPEGGPLMSYTQTHERDLHLIVVGRDLSFFRHVHPTLGSDGVWAVSMTLADAGVYKAFADFTPGARASALVLGTDLTVAGAFAPRPLPEVSRTSSVDGYTVTLDGHLTAGRDSDVVMTVRKDGRAVTDLQPYLGAFGHLVAIRLGDLAYLHVHPEAGPPRPGITFTVEVPTVGTYRLFLDFKYGDKVRTAAFTVNAARS